MEKFGILMPNSFKESVSHFRETIFFPEFLILFTLNDDYCENILLQCQIVHKFWSNFMFEF
jgi:hypothetical protein